MLRKVLSVFLTFALVVTLLPTGFVPQTKAAGTYFIFEQLGEDPDTAPKTNDDQIDLEGSYNSVSETSITYSVEQILNENATPMTVGLKRENTTAGLAAVDGNISVVGMELFPGLNRVTFKGNAGFSELKDVFYIEYVDSPVLYDLELSGNGGTFPLNNQRVIITEEMTTQPGTGNIYIQGKAPNADEVFVYINEDFSKQFPVLNDIFYASGLKLEKGLNEVRFVVKNDTQQVETTREFLYFNGDVTLFDVRLGGDKNSNGSLDAAEGYDLEENPTIPVANADDLLLSGSLVVPNHYEFKPEPPEIQSAVLKDEDSSGDWSDGDTLTITFDADTNEASPGGLDNDAEVDDLIDFDPNSDGSVDLGDDFSAYWLDSRTLVITVDNAANNNIGPGIIGEEIGIVASADLRTENELSDASSSVALLSGTYDNTGGPYIESVIAKDGSNSEGIAKYDTIDITFSKPTDMMGYAVGNTIGQAEIDAVFDFSGTLANAYYGEWLDNQTLRLVIDDPAGGNMDVGDTITLNQDSAGTKILDDGGTIDAEVEDQTYVITGTFGDSVNVNYESNPPADPSNFTSEDDIELTIYSDGEAVATVSIDHSDLEQNTTLYSYDENQDYFVFEFNDIDIGFINGGGENFTPAIDDHEYTFDTQYSYMFEVKNYVKTANNGVTTKDSQSGFSFSFQDEAEPYITQVRNIFNYEAGLDYEDIEGVSVNGEDFEVFEAPFVIELGVNPNVDISGLATTDVTIEVLDNNGVTVKTMATDGSEFNLLAHGDVANTPVNHRFLEILKLPRVGYQILKINFSGGPAYQQPVTYVFGPYATFDDLYEGLTVESPDDDDTDAIGIRDLDFSGELFNVDPSTIVDSDDAGDQTIFFTINGKNVDIYQQDIDNDGASDEDTGKFTLDNPQTGQDENDDAQNMLNSGNNTVKFTYQYGNEFYTREMVISVFPTDFPEVPAKGSAGIYPYSTDFSDPRKDPDHFTELSSGIYSTKENEYNIFGSFRLYEFTGSISAELAAIQNDDYRFEILRNGETIVEWDLAQNHFETDNGVDYNSGNDISNFDVIYDRSDDYFTFILRNQSMAEEDGKAVYQFVAYKETANTQYRLEIQHVDIPYTLLRPILPEQEVINQNYLDVVIHSESAESIVIDDYVGEKIDFDEDNDGDIDFQDAFKIRVKDLKENRDNDIEFTITLESGEEIEGSFTVHYAPTNVPGAQYVEEMSRRHRVFNDTLELEFEKGTVLKKKHDPTDTAPVNQLYAKHDLLFGIANRFDGVVDRRQFEEQPSGFAHSINLSELEFRATLPDRFVSASPVYWIDAGMADDPNSGAFDPVETGFLPLQFPDSGLPNYMERDPERTLVPSNRGELTLAYDPYVVENAGTLITVFRYDPDLQMWENIGGQVDARKNTVTVPFDQFGYYTVMKLQYSFVDITQHPYARDEMEAIYTKGVMNSFDSQDFGANSTISRAEFAAMIVKALQLPLNYDDSNLHFDDVPTVIVPGSLWDYRYIETAAREGIVRGSDPRIFEPNAELTREQAAIMLARAMELKLPVDREKIDQALAKEFQDYSRISYYARPAIIAITKLGLMKGAPVDVEDESQGLVFEPHDNLLRSDAAIMMSRVMAEMDLLPEMN